jgi:hypothetical protein
LKLKKLSLIFLCLFLISCNTGIGTLPPVPGNTEILKFSLQNTAADSDWMGQMSEIIGSRSLRNIIIPGTHDSGTYNISEKSAISPDNTLDASLSFIDSLMQNIYKLPFFGEPDPELKRFFARWSKAQDKTIMEQLEAGIRYFDLRVLRRSDGEFYIVHGMYSDNINNVFADVNRFLENHPKEIVILDFNHLYHFKSDHENFIGKINGSFRSPDGSSKLIPASRTVNITLNELWQNRQQVIALYADRESVAKHPELWPQSAIFSPWPDKQDINSLQQSLENILSGKLFNIKKNDFSCTVPSDECQGISKDKFFVLQGVVTPNAKLILESHSAESDLKEAGKRLESAVWYLDNTNKKLAEARDRYNRAFFLFKPFYTFEINRLVSQKNVLELEVAARRSSLEKAQVKSAGIPHSLQEIAQKTTPFITSQLKNQWAGKDLNIIIADWFEITGYVETIKTLNIQRQ